jgi:hypothetical protein
MTHGADRTRLRHHPVARFWETVKEGATNNLQTVQPLRSSAPRMAARATAEAGRQRSRVSAARPGRASRHRKGQADPVKIWRSRTLGRKGSALAARVPDPRGRASPSQPSRCANVTRGQTGTPVCWLQLFKSRQRRLVRVGIGSARGLLLGCRCRDRGPRINPTLDCGVSVMQRPTASAQVKTLREPRGEAALSFPINHGAQPQLTWSTTPA